MTDNVQVSKWGVSLADTDQLDKKRKKKTKYNNTINIQQRHQNKTFLYCISYYFFGLTECCAHT